MLRHTSRGGAYRVHPGFPVSKGPPNGWRHMAHDAAQAVQISTRMGHLSEDQILANQSTG